VGYKAGTELTNGLVRYNYSNGNIVGGTTPSYQRFSIAGMVTPVPEPSAALLGIFGALGLLRRRR
jgi:MYXO-CTERM domain-containing protein